MTTHCTILLLDSNCSSRILREKYDLERKALKAIPFFSEIAQLFEFDPIMYGLALERMKLDNLFISECMRNNEEIMLKAIRLDFCRIYDASNELKKNREFVMKALRVNGRAFELMVNELRNDQELVRLAIENGCGDALEFANEDLRSDRELVLKLSEIR
ncbi:predicted protein [Naegleria gruberi]|uniref:Predicted protein n=1 Tax=Naegleria gruberi TaxID=5762 RepID=D2W6T5_NAEGR|nr:uncharacterized protein NAEGRDRAFT_55032 [Naegleria gruberi]EFC35217.1 predicted protein [Naegleria gruberi]|eukprot:XP_002667961.1 predicted protein [Naegleria gruberi strain NEG-M]